MQTFNLFVFAVAFLLVIRLLNLKNGDITVFHYYSRKDDIKQRNFILQTKYSFLFKITTNKTFKEAQL